MAEGTEGRAPLLGRVPTPEATKRSSNVASEARRDIGAGVKKAAIVTIAVGASVTIPHGLKTIPMCIQLSGKDAPIPGVFYSKPTKTDVTVTNDGPDPATVDVAIFG